MTNGTTILDTRAAVVSDVEAFLPDLQECIAHPGRFNAEELQLFVARPPAVRIAVLGIASGTRTPDDALRVVASFAAFIVTGDAPGLPRDAAAINLVEAVAGRVNTRIWNEACEPAENIRAENLYSSQVNNNNLALWAVTWGQPIILDRRDDDAGALPRKLYVTGGLSC